MMDDGSVLYLMYLRSNFSYVTSIRSIHPFIYLLAGKYTAILAILIVGSFIIPMAQYFWYVKDDSGGNNFFNQQKAPEPEPEPPKKKGWFN